jgi:hypothetical protein
MPPEQIQDSDIVSRSIYSPKDYSLNDVGVLDLKRSFVFQEKHQYSESVNCNRLLNNSVDAIHALGIRKLDNDNARLIKEGNNPRVYTGFVSSGVEKVRNTARVGDMHFEVLNTPIPENLAHCDIKLNFSGTRPNTAQKSLVVQRLCDCFDRETLY